ncbi:hypothetical protein BJX66DRAFT_201317 [Aspergillus keveii]|uniref:Secreted protein n=1 Tax=Aspergillus keveii TaxID=714993 RepID=A0ABR4G5M9_9EURO
MPRPSGQVPGICAGIFWRWLRWSAGGWAAGNAFVPGELSSHIRGRNHRNHRFLIFSLKLHCHKRHTTGPWDKIDPQQASLCPELHKSEVCEKKQE